MSTKFGYLKRKSNNITTSPNSRHVASLRQNSAKLNFVCPPNVIHNRLWEVRKMAQPRINYAPETCAYCGGKGYLSGAGRCPVCGGTGWAHALRHEE